MLDNTDKNILKELQRNSRITMKELGKKVHLTGAATAARVAKLEDNGIIEKYTIQVNRQKLGCAVHVMLTVTMTKSGNHEPYLSFINKKENYIINNYKISGHGCYIIEGIFPSNEILDEFLTELNTYANYLLNIIISETKKNNQCY